MRALSRTAEESACIVSEAAPECSSPEPAAIEDSPINLSSPIIAFLRDRYAMSAVEYALIVVAVIAVVGSATVLLGGSFNAMFNDLGNQVATTLD